MRKIRLLLIALVIPFFAFSQTTPTSVVNTANQVVNTANQTVTTTQGVIPAPQECTACDSCNTACKPYPWEVGALVGMNQYFGDMHCSKLYLSNPGFVAGAYLRRFFGDYFALRGNLMFGKLGANDLDKPDHAWDYRRLKFTTNFTELALLGEFYPLKERRYDSEGNMRRSLSPYLFAGAGVLFTNPTVTVQPGQLYAGIPDLTKLAADKIAAKNLASLVIPVGVGVKYNVTDRWTLGLEASYHFVNSDLIDGVSTAGNPNKKDGFAVANLMAGYRFGSKDTDKDGVVDKCDVCPNEKGLRKFQGCPDTDGDGTPDRCDACPTVAGPMALKGCPDTDGDGIPDKDDACPTIPGLASLQGCPDRDGDGIADKDDACPDVAGIKALKGCPDTDGDGITDKDDACPNVAGPASLNGCPDRDGDGIADDKDKCPDVAGVVANNGCPEEKAFINGKDGYRSASGCQVSSAELSQLTVAANSIEFYAGTNKLKPNSYKGLDKVCAVLQRCPDTVLGINAYNDGANNAANLKSAKLRACAIYAYFLKKKCISKARMHYQGLGDEDANASYVDAQGKKIGSRVEFQLK